MEKIKELITNYQPTCQQEEADKKEILNYLNLFDNLLSRENTIAHFTSSAFIVNPNRTKVLFIHHKIFDKWAWTGGHVDGNQDFLRVALKEAREETGLENFKVLSEEIGSLDIIPVNGHLKHHEWVSSHQHLSVAYLLEASESEVLCQNEAETNGVAWLPLAELEAYSQEPHIFPVYRKMLARLKNSD